MKAENQETIRKTYYPFMGPPCGFGPVDPWGPPIKTHVETYFCLAYCPSPCLPAVLLGTPEVGGDNGPDLVDPALDVGPRCVNEEGFRPWELHMGIHIQWQDKSFLTNGFIGPIWAHVGPDGPARAHKRCEIILKPNSFLKGFYIVEGTN